MLLWGRGKLCSSDPSPAYVKEELLPCKTFQSSPLVFNLQSPSFFCLWIFLLNISSQKKEQEKLGKQKRTHRSPSGHEPIPHHFIVCVPILLLFSPPCNTYRSSFLLLLSCLEERNENERRRMYVWEHISLKGFLILLQHSKERGDKHTSSHWQLHRLRQTKKNRQKKRRIDVHWSTTGIHEDSVWFIFPLFCHWSGQ